MDRFSNLSLADRYAAIKAEIDGLSKLLDEAKAMIKLTGQEKIEGTYATIEVGLSERCTFDSKVAKTFLTEEQAAACTKKTLVETIRVKAKVPA